MSRIEAIGLAAAGVTFVRSPRYLAEKIADAVDERAPDVRDESHFWRNVVRVYDLMPSELPQLQARIAAKYCLNLDIWKTLPELRRDHGLFLLYSGPETILECWRTEYPLDKTFDGIVRAAERRLTARDAALYAAFAEQAGCPPETCLVVESLGPAWVAAKDAGLHAYRYGTAFGLRRWLRGTEVDEGSGAAPPLTA